MPISIEVVEVTQDPVVIEVAVVPGLVVAADYTNLINKPGINGVSLAGDQSAFVLGLAYETEAKALRQWVAYLSQLVGRIPLYNTQGQFNNQWAAVVGIDDGQGVYNLKVDDSDIIPTPAIPPILTEPTE